METPTPHDISTSCVKLTIVTHLSCSERLAKANLSFFFFFFSERATWGGWRGGGGRVGGCAFSLFFPPVQQITSGNEHRVKLFFWVGNQQCFKADKGIMDTLVHLRNKRRAGGRGGEGKRLSEGHSSRSRFGECFTLTMPGSCRDHPSS